MKEPIRSDRHCMTAVKPHSACLGFLSSPPVCLAGNNRTNTVTRTQFNAKNAELFVLIIHVHHNTALLKKQQTASTPSGKTRQFSGKLSRTGFGKCRLLQGVLPVFQGTRMHKLPKKNLRHAPGMVGLLFRLEMMLAPSAFTLTVNHAPLVCTPLGNVVSCR